MNNLNGSCHFFVTYAFIVLDKYATARCRCYIQSFVLYWLFILFIAFLLCIFVKWVLSISAISPYLGQTFPVTDQCQYSSIKILLPDTRAFSVDTLIPELASVKTI